MGDKRISEEKEFLEALCQRKGDTISQSTPIKRRRSGDHCASAGINYNDSHEDSFEVFDFSHCSDDDDHGIEAKDKNAEHHEGSIEVFDSSCFSENATEKSVEKSLSEALQDRKTHAESHEESMEVFDASYCSENTTETNVEKSPSGALEDRKTHAEHHKESIEVFDASYCSESTTETNVLVEKSSSEALQDRKTHDLLRTDEDILWLMSTSTGCCQSKCFRKVSMEDIKFCERSMKSLKQTDRRNLILDYLHKHSKAAIDGGTETKYIVGGTIVCKCAWLQAHNIKAETFRRVYMEFEEGVMHIEHGNLGSKKLSKKTKDCIAWLEFFVDSVGQHQPDLSVIHIPSCFSLSSIYKQMVEENNGFGMVSVGLSQFYHIFHTYFPNVTIPKENRFTKCTDCTKYKEQKERTMDKKVRNEVDALLNKHLELVWQERRVYYKHRYKARRFPDKYLTVIDDGMDQKTTNIPRVRRKTKATCNLTSVGTHLVGAILHSGQSNMSGKEIYGSFDFYQWPHDPNLTASVLLNMIAKWCQFYKLPPIFYLQLDNCVKENKNQYMMWLFALLVELLVFDKIKLNFLPVGHTHEEIDAFFGVYSKHLDLNDVYTMDEMQEAMKNCIQNVKVLPFLLDAVYNIKEWLAPHAEQLHDHTQPKCFKFVRNAAGKCEMFYRNYSHMPWEGPVVILKSHPGGKPSLVRPVLDRIDVEGLKRDLNKFRDHYPEQAFSFWSEWVNNVDNLVAVPETWEWPLDAILIAEKIKPYTVDQSVPEHLQALQDKECRPTKQIYTGRYVAPSNRENPVERVDSFYEGLQIETYAAVFLSNCEEEPVIGVLKEMSEDHFKIHYWKGTYRGKWSPLSLPRTREPWTEVLPKECIILHSFELTEAKKLQVTTRRHLMEKYSSLRNSTNNS